MELVKWEHAPCPFLRKNTYLGSAATRCAIERCHVPQICTGTAGYSAPTDMSGNHDGGGNSIISHGKIIPNEINKNYPNLTEIPMSLAIPC